MAASKYTRIIPVGLDNVSVNIAPLTCGQTELYLKNQKATSKIEDAEQKSIRLSELAYGMVADGLNNVGEEKWTVERVRAEFDKVFAAKIQSKIIDESGLVIPNLESPATA